MFPQTCGYVKGTVELSWNAFSTSTSPSPHSFLLLTFSFSYYPELGQTLQGKDTVLYPYIRYQPQTQVSPSYSHFCQAAINFGVPTTLSGLIHQNDSHNSGKYYTYDYGLFFVCLAEPNMWKFPGRGSSPSDRSDPSHCSDNPRSLAHCTIRELLITILLPQKHTNQNQCKGETHCLKYGKI